jgi:hypothetical protein
VDTSIALETDGSAKPLNVRETIWDYAVSGLFGDVTRLVSQSKLSTDWRRWQRYLRGDSVILLFDGSIDVHLEADDMPTSVSVEQHGSFVRIPRGAWHTATIRRPSMMLMLTPCGDTRQRPR